MRAKPSEIATALGLDGSESITLLELANLCERGLQVSCFKRLARLMDPNGRELLNSVVSPSLSRRKRGTLSACESDCLVRMADSWLTALATFQDERKTRRFLAAPHPLLGGRPPLEVAAMNVSGAAVVDQLLGRLLYGSAA